MARQKKIIQIHVPNSLRSLQFHSFHHTRTEHRSSHKKKEKNDVTATHCQVGGLHKQKKHPSTPPARKTKAKNNRNAPKDLTISERDQRRTQPISSRKRPPKENVPKHLSAPTYERKKNPKEKNTHVFPHHVCTVVAPIVPFRGYCRQKKMITAETATPESIAADKT